MNIASRTIRNLAVACCLLLAATQPLGAQVRFETGSTDLLHQKSVQSGKLVFIDLYADWCPPCRMMEREVFSKKEVGEFMEQHFVAAKYNVDQTTGRELMQRYGSGSIPLYLVFSSDGELLGRITGATDTETFLDNLRVILGRTRKPESAPAPGSKR